jgi:hypothetical protein
MKKIFNENEIDSLLFKIRKEGIATIRRILFPVGKSELNKQLNEISELSKQPTTVVRPSIVTSDGVAYHLNDDDVIKEIHKSHETIYGKGEIKMSTQEQDGSHRHLNTGEKFQVSVEIPIKKIKDMTPEEKEKKELDNQLALDQLPSKENNKS